MALNDCINIAVLPLDIAWCNSEKNLDSVAFALSHIAPDTDIVVLPELFSTGFIQDKAILNEWDPNESIVVEKRLKSLSNQFHVAIAGSMLVKETGRFYNRGFFIEPSGDIAYYDKRHLFCLSPEAEIFTEGITLPPVIRYRGWNISMVICYDLRFPVWCRNQGARTDIMIVPANWPASRGFAWKQLLIARAIENQCMVVGANRSGEDDYGDYNGLSFVFDASGHEIAYSDDAQNDIMRNVLYARYSKEELTKVRKKLPVGNDADNFTIQV